MNRKKDLPAPAEPSGPVVYCGPTLPGIARQYTVYQNGIPVPLAEALAETPLLKGLVLPLDCLPEARRSIESGAGQLSRLYGLARKKRKEA